MKTVRTSYATEENVLDTSQPESWNKITDLNLYQTLMSTDSIDSYTNIKFPIMSLIFPSKGTTRCQLGHPRQQPRNEMKWYYILMSSDDQNRSMQLESTTCQNGQ